MSSSYSSLDLVLSHWAHFTVHRFICVFVKEYSSEYSDSAFKVEDTIVSRR